MPLTRRQFEAALAPGPLILDGAVGTELERRGVAMPAPLWSAQSLIDRPEVVLQIHADYVAAGCDILVANTFRTNPRATQNTPTGATGGESGHAGAELTRQAVELARAAATDADRNIWIAASVAPVEDCYAPQRVPNATVLRDEHELFASWIKAAGADLAWIETMNTVREIEAAATAAVGMGLPFVVSMVLREEGTLLSGEPLAEAVAAVEPLGPLAIGLNCIPPLGVSMHLPRLRALTSLPLIAYAHIGDTRPLPGWTFAQADVPPLAYADEARRWCDAGAAIVGGCCGTTPTHIAALESL